MSRPATSPPAASPPLLETDRLMKRFGGLVAVKSVSLSVDLGQVHAVIGPNGAGKTTLINLLSGDLPPTSGRLLLRGEEVTGLPANRLSHHGIGRSYQRTNIFPEFTVRRNCWLAGQSRLASSFRFFRSAAAYRQVGERVDRALALTGLAGRADRVAALLSHGEQRQLEIAMMLATEPEILLLDEPMAGMGPEESLQVVELLQSLRAGHAMILIEHDMDAVFTLADRLTVMVDGEVLASGTPEAIRNDPAVRRAYLGEEVPA